MSRGFLEATTVTFGNALTRAMLSERTARMPGLLQSLDSRVRVISIFALVLATAICRRIAPVAMLLGFAVVLALLSRVRLMMLTKRVWLIVLGFTGVIALPALLVTPGRTIATAGGMAVTEQGLRTAVLLVLRVETAVTFTTLLIVCTPWAEALKALRALGLPRVVITMLAMTYRYIFLLIESAGQMFESRRSRMVGVLPPRQQRQMAARTAGVLVSKSVALSNDVYLAMQSRGFRGEVETLEAGTLKMSDYSALLLFVAAAGLAMWVGR